MNDRIKLFLKYAEHHMVDITKIHEDEFNYCNGIFCDDCVLDSDHLSAHILLNEDMIYIEKNFPEYFI